MNAFDQAVKRTLAEEGGFTIDTGGATMRGISARFLQLTTGRVWTADEIKAITEEQAVAIYRKHFWDALGLDALPARIAAKAFDCAVNAGPATAARVLQRALRAIGRADGVVEDGKLGPVTIAAVRTACDLGEGDTLLVAMRSEQAGYYRSLAAHDQGKNARYLRGWLRRAYDEGHADG